jgi:hypothetical protein
VSPGIIKKQSVAALPSTADRRPLSASGSLRSVPVVMQGIDNTENNRSQPTADHELDSKV